MRVDGALEKLIGRNCMTLLYLLDHTDGLSPIFSRFFDEIITISEPTSELSRAAEDICCIVVDLAESQSMQKVAKYRDLYRGIPMLVVTHKGIDMQASVRMGVDGFILHPYDEDQIARLMGKFRYEKDRKDVYEEKARSDRDHITSLLNADSLFQKIKSGEDNALLLINIDNFDMINTLYGMDMGDKVLAKVAGYLHKMVPDNSSLHRLDADEFVFLLNAYKDDQAGVLSKQIKSFFELTHFKIDGIDFNLRVSIGIASGSDISLFHHAKIALKEAKDSGKNTIVRFRENSPFLKKQRETLFWIDEVKSALEEERIHAYYQPIFDNHSGKVLKYEALCRLEASDKQIYPPERFIYAARLGGLMTNLTRAMIDTAFKRFSENSYEFSINVTREDLNERYILSFLKRKCYLYNIAPSRVFIEVMDEISLDLMGSYLEQLQALSEHGFKLAIDDFGTESSNYSTLLELKADYLKIDGCFIENIDQDENTQLIVESIVEFSKKIGASTIAEYVNSPSVFKKIRELGVDHAQGYYIGKAQPYLMDEQEIA